MLSPDNTLEMLTLLGDDDFAEIREKWRRVFLRHTQRTIEEIMDYFSSKVLKDLEEGIDREENAWKNLVERGNYSDLVLYYNPDAPEDVEPTCVSDTKSDSEVEADEKCSLKTEAFHQ